MSSVFYRKYTRLSGRSVVNHIKEFLEARDVPLTPDQKEELEIYWGEDVGRYGDLGLPFQAYKWTKVEFKGNPLVRLAFPLLVVFIIMMTLVIRPIHWLITGSWWFKESTKVEDFCNRWWVNTFGE